jgi:hypothetical protein
MGDHCAAPVPLPALCGVNMRVNGDRNLGGERNRVQFVVCTSNIDAVHMARPWQKPAAAFGSVLSYAH